MTSSRRRPPSALASGVMRRTSNSSRRVPAARTTKSRRRFSKVVLRIFAVVFFASALVRPAAAQTHYASGQDVVPAFEGWEKNADGSFNMVFGYMNRNYEEEIDLPVGADNMIEP